jgi:nitrile hydratase
MNGVHDLGGMHGFGRIPYSADEPVFHERWEARVFGLSLALGGRGPINLDATRHRGERLDPVAYFHNGYYGRWLAALEMLLEEEGLLAGGEIDARLAAGGAAATAVPAAKSRPRGGSRVPLLSVIRPVAQQPLFALGEVVRTRNHQPAGHTRLPAYARCRRGIVRRVHPAMVFPDTNAHGLGENPQYVYSVEFQGEELWGDAAEPGTCLMLDLFESYLQEP